MSDGTTPLFIAAQQGHIAVVDALLEKNVNPNQAKLNGATPLLVAAQNGHPEIVKALLKNAANPSLAMSDGTTPLFIAAQNDRVHIVEYLLLHGADCDKKFQTTIDSLDKFADEKTNDNNQLKERMTQFILEYQKKNPTAEKIEITPEQIACIMGNMQVQQVFISYLQSQNTNDIETHTRKLPQIFSAHHIQNNNEPTIDNKIPRFKI